MSDMAAATFTKQAISLPYEAQRELLDTLALSVRKIENTKKRLYTQEEAVSILNSFMGRSHCWHDEDAVEYQRRMREDRKIV